MLKTFITSYKVRTTYRANSIIYALKNVPILKHIIPYNFYSDSGVKFLANFMSVTGEIASTFLTKILYLIIVAVISDTLMPENYMAYVHILVLFSIIGALINNKIINPSKDAKYCILYIKINPREYSLSNYIFFLIKSFVGMLVCGLIVGSFIKVPVYLTILLTIFNLFIKVALAYLDLTDLKKPKGSVNAIVNIVVSMILLAIAILLPAVLDLTMPIIIFYILFALSILLSVYSVHRIINYKDYLKLYKRTFIEMEELEVSLDDSNYNNIKVVKETKLEENVTSNKAGYAFFHDLFVKRHSKILTKAIKKQSIVILSVCVLTLLVVILFPQTHSFLNNITMKYLSYFVFLMYLLNRGTVLTQAMFVNCDHSLLTYRFYRKKDVILGVFKERLKTLVYLNLYPALIIAVTLPLILLLSGGTNNPLNYLVLFISIISMSIFFSVHNLVMYYLLQPYNINTEIKSGTYKIMQGITYLVCYYMVQIEVPTFVFGASLVVFNIIYIALALILAYTKAPKTFKIRE